LPARLALLAVLGVAVAATTLLLRSMTAEAEPPAGASADPLDGYVGSDACADCHRVEHGAWKETLHSRMEQPAGPATVIGRFTAAGTVVEAEAKGKRIVMIREGDAYWIEAPDAEGKPVRWRVERTVGNRYKQRYLTRFDDGSWHALPVQWFQKDGTFVEWNRRASAKPGSGEFWADEAWQWQLKCAGCHATGLDLGYDAASKTYATRWSELAIGCEACHGPGEAHVEARGGVGNVLCPSRMTRERQLDVCGKCHSRGTAGPERGAPHGLPGRLEYPFNMKPGTALDEALVQVARETHPKEFWPDDTSRNHHQQWTDYVRSPMWCRGGDRAPTCTTCHDPHRADALAATIEDNALCVACHEAFRAKEALARHTGHGGDPLANAGARCVECHMPRIAEHAGSLRLRSHAFRAPDPARAEATNSPDACLLCHADKDAAWSKEAAARIWPRAGVR
jgi:predicted CXXCH cytochrome family protein